MTQVTALRCCKKINNFRRKQFEEKDKSLENRNLKAPEGEAGPGMKTEIGNIATETNGIITNPQNFKKGKTG